MLNQQAQQAKTAEKRRERAKAGQRVSACGLRACECSVPQEFDPPPVKAKQKAETKQETAKDGVPDCPGWALACR